MRPRVKFAFVLSSWALALLAVEGIAKVALSRSSLVDRATLAAYDRPWFSRDFLAASTRQPGGWWTPPGTRIVLPLDWSDPWFTVRGGRRATTGQGRGREIWCLGGSTTYCSEVPDALTWPSQLQARLPEARVVNMGATSVKLSQEVERLEYELARGPAPEVVVCLDGVNECVQGVLYGHPDGWIADEEHPSPFAVANLWRQVHHPSTSRVAPMVENYLAARARMSLLCAARGIRVFFLLQPCLPLSPGASGPSNPATARALLLGYEGLRAFVPREDDLSRVLVGAGDVFLDGFHVNDLGNERIAGAVARRLSLDHHAPK